MATKQYVVSGDQYRIIDRRMREVKRQLDQDGGSPLDPDLVAHALQQIVEGRFQQKLDQFLVVVDYSQPLKDMIKAGRYDWTNSDITDENFLIKGKGKTEVKLELVHFNRAIGTDEVLKGLDRLGFRPAKIEELLAFGAAYPEKQREFPIICLGSVWSDRFDDRNVPYLFERGSKRKLSLYWIDNVWDDRCRFLAVRK